MTASVPFVVCTWNRNSEPKNKKQKIADLGSFNYFIVPQGIPHPDNIRDHVDFIVCLKRHATAAPVLFLEVKDDRHQDLAPQRLNADFQIRDQFGQMLACCPFPRLYGVSILGTSMRLYRGNRATGVITPNLVSRPHNEQNLPRDFLGEAWDLDILSQGGLRAMQEAILHITHMSTH